MNLYKMKTIVYTKYAPQEVLLLNEVVELLKQNKIEAISIASEITVN
jgi:hypothetical protein